MVLPSPIVLNARRYAIMDLISIVKKAAVHFNLKAIGPIDDAGCNSVAMKLQLLGEVIDSSIKICLITIFYDTLHFNYFSFAN